MLILRRGSQPDYRLCNMTVTVYHREGLTRQVFNRAYYEYASSLDTHKGVQAGDGSMLLVLPGPLQTVFPGDKVMPGVGPEMTDWGQLTPANTPGLRVIGQVACKFFGGKMCHVEAK